MRNYERRRTEFFDEAYRILNSKERAHFMGEGKRGTCLRDCTVMGVICFVVESVR